MFLNLESESTVNHRGVFNMCLGMFINPQCIIMVYYLTVFMNVLIYTLYHPGVLALIMCIYLKFKKSCLL